MKEQNRDSKQRIAFVQLFAEAAASAVLDKIHVVPTGKWSGPIYSKMEITPAHYRSFEHALLAACANFGLLKAIKGAILDCKPSESGECRLTPMLDWSGTLGRRLPNEYADR
jgi:hypothetical protein